MLGCGMVEMVVENYNLEFDKIVKVIEEKKPKTVLLQFPDGVKPHATEIVEELEKKISNVEFRIWLGDCFGACDVPDSDCDLLVQFGHAPWI